MAIAKKPYEPTAVDFEILKLVKAYHFLTVNQIMRLRGLSKNSLSTEQPRLKKLADNEYLDRRKLPYTTSGNKEFVYSLATHGVNYLKDAGLIDSSRFRRDILLNVKFPHLDHALALNNFLIAASLLEKAVPYISLVETRHDLDLKKTPVRVTVERRMPYGDRIDEKITVIPDGWLDFRMPVLDLRKCIVVELDRGTTSIAPFKEKLRALYGYAVSLEYQELFGTDLCVVAYATTEGTQRLQQMIEWCEQELEQQRLEHEAILYRFTSIPDGDLDPKHVFCDEVWYKPFESEPVSLLWKTE